MTRISDNIRTYSADQHLVANRREHIARCAAHLIIRKGYAQTSVREIADTCDMAMGTLYRYIGVKGDVLYLVIELGVMRLIEFIDRTLTNMDNINPTQALRQALEEYYRLVDDLQDLMLFTYQETRNLQPQARNSVLDTDKRIVALFEALLAKGRATGEFKIDDVKMVAHNIVIIGHMWATRRWYLREWSTLEVYTREQTKLIFKMVCPWTSDGFENRDYTV